MARTISHEDVWRTCDALLLEGARPTAERVRERLGLKSISGVAPHLETWFTTLGARLKDATGPAEASPSPAPPPTPPSPMMAAAQAFWNAAQAEARQEAEQRIRAATLAASEALKTEKRRAVAAENAVVAAQARMQELEVELSARNAALREVTLARAAAAKYSEAARAQILDLETRLAARETELANVRNAAKRHVTMAVQRVTETEQRAAAEIKSLQVRLASMMADPARP
jgi:plasmid replication DNA-binding protein KfrA